MCDHSPSLPCIALQPSASSGSSIATATAAATGCQRSGRSLVIGCARRAIADVIPLPRRPGIQPSVVEPDLVGQFARLLAMARDLGQRQRVDLHLAEA